jgi:radical SAM superfamily enzyme YgiQ (UPF0313 family)
MNVALIEIVKPGDNKDYNNGFGTTFDLEKSIKTKILQRMRIFYEHFPTLSYAYISAIFKKYNNTVSYYKNQIPEIADLAIINTTAIRFSEELSAIKALKSKNIKVCVYGAMADALPEYYSDADIVITENYESVFELIAQKGLIISGIIKGEQRNDLDLIPIPDWDIFKPLNFSYAPLLPGKPFVFSRMSLGCPYQCSYCPHKNTKTYLKRSVENVINELVYLKDKYKVKRIHFRDSYFCLNDDEITIFNHLYHEKKLKIKWGIETRADYLNEKNIKALYKAGLRAIKLGIESASDKHLKKYNRTVTDINHVKNIIKLCRKLGIRTNACYIIGFPDETLNQIKATIKLSKKINTSFANFFIFTPLPKTDFIRDNMINITDNTWEQRDNFHLIFEHKNFTPIRLRKLQKKAITGYYFRCKWILLYIVEKFIRLFRG